MEAIATLIAIGFSKNDAKTIIGAFAPMNVALLFVAFEIPNVNLKTFTIGFLIAADVATYLLFKKGKAAAANVR